jgi:Kef-type K+ transport system membrane component KefB/nucleotide-binding universal stress UspA family protein
MELPALSNHSLVLLWVELAALILAARALGALARRWGQPSVVGELLAGLILGPSVFGQLWPTGFAWFLPPGHRQGDLLLTVAALSLVLLLVVIGAETDLPLIRSLGRAAGSVSAFSLVVPFAAGLGAAVLLPAVLLGPHHNRLLFALLIAGAVSVSSLPVIAKIITGLGAVRRNFGQLALAAGTANDVFGFLVVAVATGLAGAGMASGSQLAVALAGLGFLIVVAFTVGQRAVDAMLRHVRRLGPNVTGSLGICIATALVAAAATQAIGVEGALGGFLAGVLLGRSRFQQGEGLRHLERLSTAFLAPIYFSTAGLRVNLADLATLPVLVSFLVLTVVAAVAKFAGAALGARLARLPRREALALGVGLNGRGALQVIIATAGLATGAFGQQAYTIVILLSIVTSVATPPLLRTIVAGWRGSEGEQARLEKEERLERNVVVRGQRLLLPSRGSPNSLVAAEVLDFAWPQESPVTILSIGSAPGGGPGRAHDTTTVADVLANRQVEQRHVPSDHVLDSILAEARLGYGVIGVGAAEEPVSGHLLSPVVDDLLARSPIPLLLVRRAHGLDRPLPPAFARALVPVVGTAPSRAAQEVAATISNHLGTALLLMHVVTRPPAAAAGVVVRSAPALAAGSAGGARLLGAGEPVRDGAPRPEAGPPGTGAGRSGTDAAHGVLREATALARQHGAETVGSTVRAGMAAGPEIVLAAEEAEADLVVLGTTVRLIDGSPFLGHTVEHVLANCPATVAVVVLPDPSVAGTGGGGAPAPDPA